MRGVLTGPSFLHGGSMATQLFKDGIVVFVDAREVQNHLDVGWLLEDPNAPKRLPAGIEIINQTITLPENPTLEAKAKKAITKAHNPAPKKRGPKSKSK
jgi:hypothetical protein